MNTVLSQPWFSARQPERRRLHLTPRELEVLALLCEGLPNKLISRRLNISAATVKCHISRILDELGVASRLQAVVVAARFGLVTPAGAEPAGEPRLQADRFANRVLQPKTTPRALVAAAA
ncbi:MAG: response regulator transcription factor [Burkholderiales bacterium]